MIPSGTGYRSYIYVNEVPYALITPSEFIYRDTPVQIGTWLDGIPVWRAAFENRSIPYDENEPVLYTDKSYTPFYDYEHKCSKYVKSTSDVLLLNGMMQLDVSGETVLCKRWSNLEFDADISNLNGYIRHETMYFTGYVEFVTVTENIKEA